MPEAPTNLPGQLVGQVLLKCGDKITTDHIMPAGTHLKLRSNVPEYAKVVFNCFNEPGKPTFAERALKLEEPGHRRHHRGGRKLWPGLRRESMRPCARCTWACGP